MKTQSKLMIVTVLIMWVSLSFADTFKHRETGDVFTGFATQKVTGGKTLVYNSDESKMTPVVLSDYEVTSDRKGRRNTVSLLLLNQPEVFLSDAVSKQAARVITDTSNKGPQAIILQIDSPGGRGGSMKTIADAVSQTTNCPVIAYISKGAYSAAAVVSLACDKIYMKPTAGIGAAGSIEGSVGDRNYAEHLSIYSSDFQLNDFLYATVLAQKHDRPEQLAKALIDRSISIIEVVNIDGSRAFVEEKDRQATQTLVRTLCEGMPVTKSETVAPADIVGKVLNLTAKDAIEFGLADAYAESTGEILADMQLSDAKLSPVPGVEKVIKKYTAARRNISEGLSRIEQYEQNIETLSEQFATIDNQLRTGTQTRETIRADLGYRSNRRRETVNLDSNQDINGIARSRQGKNSRENATPRAQMITTEEPRVNIEIVYAQLTNALRDVVGEYRRVLNLVDRWPSGLPIEVSKTMLQKDMDSASSELKRLYRYQPVYPSQEQTQIPQNPSTNRSRY